MKRQGYAPFTTTATGGMNLHLKRRLKMKLKTGKATIKTIIKTCIQWCGSNYTEFLKDQLLKSVILLVNIMLKLMDLLQVP